jgi:hypothetical protein
LLFEKLRSPYWFAGAAAEELKAFFIPVGALLWCRCMHLRHALVAFRFSFLAAGCVSTVVSEAEERSKKNIKSKNEQNKTNISLFQPTCQKFPFRRTLKMDAHTSVLEDEYGRAAP